MGKTAISMGGENKDAWAMGVLAMNLAEVCPNIADRLVIYHDGISENDKALINSIFPARFIDYDFQLSFRDKLANSSLRGFTGMVFYKYEILKLIQEYDRVILTDYDVIINKDISELNDLYGFNAIQGQSLRQVFWKNIPDEIKTEYNIDAPGISAPLIVIDKNWQSQESLEELYRFCIASTHKYARYIKSPEECIITMMFQKFDIPYNLMDAKKYVSNCQGGHIDPNASILHAIGRPKFWDGLYNDVWDKRYKKWLAMGGSAYHEPLKRRLIRYTYDISIRNTIKKLKKNLSH